MRNSIKRLSRRHQSSTTPRSWAERVWAAAETKWLIRDGQDNFYTDHVVIPNLIHCIQQLCMPGFIELIDIGAGDGYCTEHLVAGMIKADFSPSRVFLLDRSQIQLEIATKRSNLSEAVPIWRDLNDYNWFTCLPPRNCQRVLVSVFAIQELPALEPLLIGLRALASQGDAVLLLTVAPKYSSILLRRGEILDPVMGSVYDDWHWRGLYPIDGAAGRLYLPHFHRTVDNYLHALNRHGFTCVGTHYLSVPTGRAANFVFSNTVYGRQIIGKHSSMILALRR